MKLAGLVLPVKEMIGGATGWTDEGFTFAVGSGIGSVGGVE